MFIIQEIAPALIAGVIVVVVDWKILLSVKTASQRKVRLSCKFGDAEERAAFHSLHASNSASLRIFAKSIAACRMHV